MSTFVSYSGEPFSMVDHIPFPVEKVHLISCCVILGDDALNVSDHRLICCHVNLPHAERITRRQLFFSETKCQMACCKTGRNIELAGKC